MGRFCNEKGFAGRSRECNRESAPALLWTLRLYCNLQVNDREDDEYDDDYDDDDDEEEEKDDIDEEKKEHFSSPRP